MHANDKTFIHKYIPTHDIVYLLTFHTAPHIERQFEHQKYTVFFPLVEYDVECSSSSMFYKFRIFRSFSFLFYFGFFNFHFLQQNHEQIERPTVIK